MASARVAASRNEPRTALVTVREPGLRTPLIIAAAVSLLLGAGLGAAL